MAHPRATRAGGRNQRPAQTAAATSFSGAGHRLNGDFPGAGTMRPCASSGRPQPTGGELPLDAIRFRVDQPRLGARSARRNHAGDDRLRRAADFHLQPRLHGARRELHPILLLLIALCRCDVRRRHRQQPAAPLHVLGGRRPHLLSAHRLLVPPSRGSRSCEKGLHHHPHRRPRPAARHGLALLARLERCSSTTTAQAASNTAR